ncbi:hypothetical protein QBC32DRAFT_337072 [Pseudoneurospora amorphoporcata]|uniref:Uncharacterized protein n=1 Tax=Pseudoneurospora amorphoporcata TaxID=241081 RepID=A0AAN6P023_9PEZI|nr:hypothetical protein QBC32DRAFT_337072 [Pseudoneurospora amorphoporcata]
MRHRNVAKNLFQKRELLDTKDSIDIAGSASHIRTTATLQKMSSPSRVLHATTKTRSAFNGSHNGYSSVASRDL